MRRIAVVLAAVAALAVAGCTEAEKDDTFAIVCASVPIADLAFQTYGSSGRVSAKVMADERAAVAAAQAVCDGPRPADTRTVLATVQRALSAIASATAAARTQVAAR